MKIGFTETLVRQIEPIMRAIEELQKTGSLRYEKPYIPKQKRGRSFPHKNKNTNKNDIPIAARS